MSSENSAGDRLRYVAQQVGSARFDAIVLTNECSWPSVEYYRDWALAAMAGCNQRGWVCIPTVWNPGTPNLDWISALDDMHCLMEEQGHIYGANIYPYWNVSLMTRNQDTQYTTYRHELIQSKMRCHPKWAITELAPDGGGWPPAVEDTTDFILDTFGKFDYIGVWVYAGNNPLPAWPLAGWTEPDMLNLAKLLTRN